MHTPNFFCIRGYMKSGTNWLCGILNCHPKIDCIGEFHWESFFEALDDNVARIAPRRREQLKQIVGQELSDMVKRSLCQLSGKQVDWIGDRTPAKIEPIVLPGAPYLVMQRNFRDVLVSRMFHLYNNPRVTTVFNRFEQLNNQLAAFQKNPWYFEENPEKLLSEESVIRDSARQWLSFIESDWQIKNRYPDLPIKLIRYEKLHEDFETTVEDIFRFLALDMPDISDDFFPGHKIEDPASPRRKGQIGDWENYFHPQVHEWVDSEIGSTLARFEQMQVD